mmetsp:Transcript_29748/g.81498  ORF Transcript_29748/g.81498 Transcript_29748/m.81498 type:complete len:701 (-) Transcript_29748:105-2207(-)
MSTEVDSFSTISVAGMVGLAPAGRPGSRPRLQRYRGRLAAPQHCQEAPCGQAAVAHPHYSSHGGCAGPRRAGHSSRSRGPLRGRSRGASGARRQSPCSTPVVAPPAVGEGATQLGEDVEEANIEDVEQAEVISFEEADSVVATQPAESDEEEVATLGLGMCAASLVSGLLDEAVDDYTDTKVREVGYALEADCVYLEYEPPIPEDEFEDACSVVSVDSTAEDICYEDIAATMSHAIVTGEQENLSDDDNPDFDMSDATRIKVRLALQDAFDDGTLERLLEMAAHEARASSPSWPLARAQSPCTRRNFQHHLCPCGDGPPVPEEPFPMDCLPMSTAVARATAPETEISSTDADFASEDVVVDNVTRSAAQGIASLATAAREEASRAIQRRWRCHKAATSASVQAPPVSCEREIRAPAPPTDSTPAGCGGPRRRAFGRRVIAPSQLPAAPAAAEMQSEARPQVRAPAKTVASEVEDFRVAGPPAPLPHSLPVPPAGPSPTAPEAAPTPAEEPRALVSMPKAPAAPTAPVAPRPSRLGSRPAPAGAISARPSGSGVRLRPSSQDSNSKITLNALRPPPTPRTPRRLADSQKMFRIDTSACAGERSTPQGPTALELDLGLGSGASPGSAPVPVPPFASFVAESPRTRSKNIGTGLLPALQGVSSTSASAIAWSTQVATPRRCPSKSIDAPKAVRDGSARRMFFG